MDIAKSYSISKHVVLEAFKRVKANKGAAGVDEQTVAAFEADLKDNLYKVWNRMSSGSYFPPAVRVVEIPKENGEKRQLGIPTVADRVAQMVAKMYLEPELERHFHPDSYGYRPNKSALEAVGKARERCWQYDWVIDLDIKGFFDNLDHDLVLRAVRKHTDCPWLLLYIERWLKTPMILADGQKQERTKGTPQGGVISPLLANLFLHYALDKWMEREYSDNPFERYADDMIVHCKTRLRAEALLKKIRQRLEECKLTLHPEKTKVIFCRDGKRCGKYPEKQFNFLGYTFRPRIVKSAEGQYFESFTPAISKKAAGKIKTEMRSWKLHLWSNKAIEDIGKIINPVLHGWINYYGRYRKSALNSIFRLLNVRLMKWAKRKYKKLKGHSHKAIEWLRKVAKLKPKLLGHWSIAPL